jgi:lipopolysaccharide/colanic/teichoic acid biosynthesis glycosyltransferase
VIDVVAGTVLLVAALPVIVVATIGTAISLRAWPFFTQTRIGRDGRPFTFIKLRTLPVHAPRYADKYCLQDLEVPRFSRMLRELHLDELPQLLLVIVGKMSLVGPRPEMPYLHEQFDPLFRATRGSVRPGCTGLWQVSNMCERMIFEGPEFDEYYVENQSVRFDLWIIMRTLRLVLPGENNLVSYNDLPAWTRRSAPTVREQVEALQPVEV